MIDRVKLRENYKEETGEHWKMICSTAQPTVQYTKWLEDKLVKNCSIPDVVGQSELCKHLEYDLIRNNSAGFKCKCGKEVTYF